MNDATRANVFRKPEGANTPEGWSDLREAVKGVREDLVATNSDRTGKIGKWAVRYPNGDRPANEADCTFMVCARNTVLSLMDKIESLYKEAGERKAEFLQYQEQAVAAAAGAAQQIEDIAKTHDGHIAALQSQIDGLLAEVKLLREQKPQAEITEEERLQDIQDEKDLNEAVERNAPIVAKTLADAEPKAIKRTPKRKTTAKAIEAISDPTPVPVTAESAPNAED